MQTLDKRQKKINTADGWLKESLLFCLKYVEKNSSNPIKFFKPILDYGSVGVLLSRETMELRPWSVCGGAAAPAVAVETDPRAADPAAVAACEDVVVRGGLVGLCYLAPASSLVFPLLLSFLLCCLDG